MFCQTEVVQCPSSQQKGGFFMKRGKKRTYAVRRKGGLGRRILSCWQLYVFLIPTLVYFVIFSYGPMYGIQIAFRDFSVRKGIWGSRWVGLEHFQRFFDSYYFSQLIKNTLHISIYSIIVGFILPILLALLVNELRNGKFKSILQTVTYAPYFISTVVFCGMLTIFLNNTNGLFNQIIVGLGGKPVGFLTDPSLFSHVFVWSGAWQGTGWGSIIYIAALAGIDEQLYEAAKIDGATRLQRIWHINLPHLLPTMITLLILSCGSLLGVGYEKVFLLQNSLNAATSEVISTYVYKAGLVQAQYSFATAVGLFNSVINFVILILVNAVAKRISDTSLW